MYCMNDYHRNILRINTTNLVKNIANVIDITDYLVQTDILTRNMAEEIECKSTRTDKTRELLKIIPRRGPTAFTNFISALRMTGNVHVADLLVPNTMIVPPRENISFEKMMFTTLTQTIASLKPVSVKTERSLNPILKVSANIYQNEIIKSKIGITELPYVVAIYGGTPKDAVVMWTGCPVAHILDEALKTYEKEIQSAKYLLQALHSGGLDIGCCHEHQFHKILRVLGSLDGKKHQPKILIENININHMSQTEIDIIAMKLHLIVYGADLKFAIRKDGQGKPSSYLVFNITTATSPVILDKHREVVRNIVREDESEKLPDMRDFKCPF